MDLMQLGLELRDGSKLGCSRTVAQSSSSSGFVRAGGPACRSPLHILFGVKVCKCGVIQDQIWSCGDIFGLTRS